MFLDIFSLVTYENDGRNVLDRQRLSTLFHQAIVVCIFFRVFFEKENLIDI
jgi:hypothetical protein